MRDGRRQRACFRDYFKAAGRAEQFPRLQVARINVAPRDIRVHPSPPISTRRSAAWASPASADRASAVQRHLRCDRETIRRLPIRDQLAADRSKT